MATNFNAAFGLKPVRHLSGAPYSGAVRQYYKSASVVMCIGDAVVLSGNGFTGSVQGVAVQAIPQVTTASAAGTITGVVVGLGPHRTNLAQTYLGTGDADFVYVADDPDLLFEVMENSVGGQLTLSNVGNLCDLVVSAGSTTTGLSNHMLDSTTGTSVQVRLMEFIQRVDETAGNSYGVWIVKINKHSYAYALAS